MSTRSTRGKLLVATPVLDDPNFSRTVVLVLEHDREGALGVVLNRPSPMPIDEPLPAWTEVASEPAVVFFGGPVARGGVIGLSRGALDDVNDGWHPVLDAGIGSVDLEMVPAEIGRIGPVRVFSGYAGWGPGQLESEVADQAWWTVEADPTDAFTDQPERLWSAVLRREGGRLALFASYSDDPELN